MNKTQILVDKYKKLKEILKEFKFNPPTGFGRTLIEIDWQKDEIIMVDVTTKNHPKTEKLAS